MSGSSGKNKSFGFHKPVPNLLIHQLPPSFIALRQELQKPEHDDIVKACIPAKNVEECFAIIATYLDIVLDGLYDVPDLCDVLLTSLRRRRIHPNQPHMRDQRLMSVELVEREGTVVLEKGSGVIAPGAQIVNEQGEILLKPGQHKCNWPFCEKIVDKHIWACQEHWWLIIPALRVKIYKTFKEGNKLTPVQTTNYNRVVKEVKEWIVRRQERIAAGHTLAMPEPPCRDLSNEVNMMGDCLLCGAVNGEICRRGKVS